MAPAKKAPATAASKKTVAAKKAAPAPPKKVAPAKAPSAKKAPAKAAPAKKAPAKAAPAKKAPAKAAPAKKVAPATAVPAANAARTAGRKRSASAAAGAATPPPAPAPAPVVIPAGKVKMTAAPSDSSKKIVQKGNGVVDLNVPNADLYHVVEDQGCVYQCTLNQTNLGANNNKFYIIQLLELDASPQFVLYTRWGRVGVPGQTMMEKVSSKMAGIMAFQSKFRSKTNNNWTNRANFNKVPGKYHLMDIDYAAKSDDDEDDGNNAKKKAKVEEKKPAIPKCTLPEEVQDIMRIISNRDYMNSVMKELDVDTKRMPLGKISKAQIATAYTYLKQIEAELKKPNPQLEGPTESFYTLIPHDFGFRRPPLINNEQMLKSKIEMLETLAELEIASKVMESEEKKITKHPLDSTYESLHCELVPLDHDSEEFKRIEEYTRNTQGKTHHLHLTVESVMKICRTGESEREKVIKKIGNQHMLWHGSRATNYIGILSQGLRIAPKEAPCTGYMFGKGIYLADCCSKSANYCYAHTSNQTGLMLLCEAALGTTKDLLQSKYMEEPQPGSNSTKGCGSNAPDPKGTKTVDGVKWPMGQIVEGKRDGRFSLLYNEFIVYDVSQVKMQYLIKMKFGRN